MIKRSDREKLLKQKGIVIWLTGLSGSGKSTIAIALEEELHKQGKATFILDGDVLRKGLNSDLGLSPNDRNENIRRAAEVAALFADAGLVVICAFISPYSEARHKAREMAKNRFIEVYVKCPVEECARRDPKGLYAKHTAGIIKGLTGIDAPYEEPENCELVINTEKLNIKECVGKIVEIYENILNDWIKNETL